MASLDRDLEFCVATAKKIFVRGYNDEQLAITDTQDSNKRAEEFGIKTRYISGKTAELCPVPGEKPKEEPVEA